MLPIFVLLLLVLSSFVVCSGTSELSSPNRRLRLTSMSSASVPGSLTRDSLMAQSFFLSRLSILLGRRGFWSLLAVFRGLNLANWSAISSFRQVVSSLSELELTSLLIVLTLFAIGLSDLVIFIRGAAGRFELGSLVA